MALNPESERHQKIILILFFAAVTLFTAFQEGYLRIISLLFWMSLSAGLLISLWLAWTISMKRLLSLVLGIFLMEYIKETIGIRSGMWTYHGVNGFYNFGVWAWVLGGLIAYTLSTKITIKQIQKTGLSFPRWLHPLLLCLISLLIPLTLGPYWEKTSGSFWIFYLILLIIGVISSWRMDLPTFSGLIITAWVVANPSEYLGSVSSKVWTFTHSPHYPPFFLLFGCWPLEILAQYSISAFFAHEPLAERSSVTVLARPEHENQKGGRP